MPCNHNWVETRWYWSDQKLWQELTCTWCGEVSLGWTETETKGDSFDTDNGKTDYPGNTERC